MLALDLLLQVGESNVIAKGVWNQYAWSVMLRLKKSWSLNYAEGTITIVRNLQSQHLQLSCMKPESLEIVGHPYDGEFVPTILKEFFISMLDVIFFPYW